MKWISCFATIRLVVLLIFYASIRANADAPVSYRQQHPLAWMHGLPAGEQPGWSNPNWFNFEVSNGNVWTAPLTMNDLKNGKQYEYFADFEQAHAILEIGHAFTDSFSASVEVPFAYRSGGTLDNFIDSFHLLIGNRRFNRQYYPENQNTYIVKTDGEDYYSRNDLANGISNVHMKLKYWLAKWVGQQKGSCPCGIAVSSQTKFPTQTAKQGGTTGDIDQSAMIHVGVPLFTASAFWMTAGVTFLGDNPAMKDWPRLKQITLYDFNLDIALTNSWGLIFSARAESPFLDRHQLEYFDISTDPATISRNRGASGWNSLVQWRGSESMGVRYRTKGGNHFQFQMVEDWGIGPYDASDDIYSNGAPDVNFILQSKFVW